MNCKRGLVMIDFLLRLLIYAVWFCLSLVGYRFIHRYEGEVIVEIGYRSPLPAKTVLRNQIDTFLNRVFYWSLCKNAKKNTRGVWVYFVMNIFSHITALISTILFVLCLIKERNIIEGLRVQMGWFLYAVMFIVGLHFFLDIGLVPSVQKKYGIKKGKKKKE